MTYKHINLPVTVTALGFRRNMHAYPRRIEFNGATYCFVDSGLHVGLGKGERASHIFTMSDGSCEYRLRRDGSRWTLLGMTG